MPLPAQVPAFLPVRIRSLACAFAALVLAAAATGCAGRIDAARLGIDDSIHTGSVRQEVHLPALEEQTASDAATIRNAVSAADLPALQGSPLPWANAETGSSGSVTRIDERMEAGRPCRSFVASRQRFDGIFLYRGEACLVAQGKWYLRSFKPAEL